MFSRFIRNQTYRIFYSFSLPYSVITEFGISFSITDLARTKFMLYLFSIFWYMVSIEKSITLKTHFTKRQSFSQNWCDFHIDQIKGRSVKRQFKKCQVWSRYDEIFSNCRILISRIRCNFWQSFFKKFCDKIILLWLNNFEKG